MNCTDYFNQKVSLTFETNNRVWIFLIHDKFMKKENLHETKYIFKRNFISL